MNITDETPMALACRLFGITPHELRSGGRRQRVAWARQALAYALYRARPGLTLGDIAELCGWQHHTTVLHALHAVPPRIQQHADYACKVEALIAAAKHWSPGARVNPNVAPIGIAVAFWGMPKVRAA